MVEPKKSLNHSLGFFLCALPLLTYCNIYLSEYIYLLVRTHMRENHKFCLRFGWKFSRIFFLRRVAGAKKYAIFSIRKCGATIRGLSTFLNGFLLMSIYIYIQ